MAKTTATATPTTTAGTTALGPKHRPAINTWRQRQMRNMLCTLLLSAGTPMLLMGDEVQRSQEATTTAGARTIPWAGCTGSQATTAWR